MISKKKMPFAFTLVFVVIVFIGCLSSFTACSASKNNTNNRSESNNQSFPSEENRDHDTQHYEVDLTMHNFSEFIKYSVQETTANSVNKTGNHYEFQGVLRFAYYKDVVVTLSAKYSEPSWQGGENYTFQFSVVLDAAGDCKFDTNNSIALEKLGWTFYKPGTTSQIEVIAVTGKVIFNI